ncbi:MAG: type III pantothenate kinase [Burkholderiales bacterium]
MILVVDAGNSRTKWAVHHGGQFTQHGWVPTAEIFALGEAWKALQSPDTVTIANVAGERAAAELLTQVGRWNLAPHFVTAMRNQCGVSSGYDDPAQLGPDRWAALIGARALLACDCLVVNVGTAMTVDALTGQGDFLGGIIVPGYELMHEALATKAARLSAEEGVFSRFPRSTRDAITSGAIQALCGALERMRQAVLDAGYAEPALVFGGGAAPQVAPRLGHPVNIVEHLVLEGLVCIAGEPKEIR